eukprot:952936-Pyramimonas_sp.AAC.1
MRSLLQPQHQQRSHEVSQVSFSETSTPTETSEDSAAAAISCAPRGQIYPSGGSLRPPRSSTRALAG